MPSRALPGVGRYAANATLVVAFGKRAPVVDGVSARVYRRYLGLPSESARHVGSVLWEEVAQSHPAGCVTGMELGGPRSSPLKSVSQPVLAAAYALSWRDAISPRLPEWRRLDKPKNGLQ